MAQTVIPLVTNTNPGEVTGGANDYMSQVLPGQTLYVGVPYAGGALPAAEPIDYFTLSTYMLSTADEGSVSFNFYTGTDTGLSLTGITPLAGMTAGTATVAPLVDDDPSAPGNTALAEVTTVLDYADLAGDPFAAAASSGGMLWLGITNTGGTTLSYYAGNPFGGGVSAPAYSFSAPFDTAATGLNADSYVNNPDGTLSEPYQNVHPYVSFSAVTVPEPDAVLLTFASGSLLLLRRRAGRARS
jgi:hypothetical protein